MWNTKSCEKYKNKKSGFCAGALGAQGQFWCAKTCGLTKCEDPNPNKECKDVAPGKIL